MFNPNWFLLILFLKVLIAAISLIQAAPIDIEPTSISPGFVENELTTSAVILANNATDIVQNDSVLSKAETDVATNLNAINHATSTEDLAFQQQFGVAGNDQEFQAEVTETTGNTNFKVENDITATSQTLMEKQHEKESENLNSQNVNENLQNENETKYLSENQQNTTLVTFNASNESNQLNESEIFNSQIKYENPQNIQISLNNEKKSANEQITTQMPLEIIKDLSQPIESEILNSQIKYENSQNIPNILNIFENKVENFSENPVEIENPNIQTTWQANEESNQAAQNQNENSQNLQNNFSSVESFQNDKNLQQINVQVIEFKENEENHNTQKFNENPQNMDKNLSQEISAIKIESSETTTEPIVKLNSNEKETPIGELKVSQNESEIKENLQNTQELSEKSQNNNITDLNLATNVVQIENAQSTIEQTTESNKISNAEKENPQNTTTNDKSVIDFNLSEQTNVQSNDPQIQLPGNGNSQIANENPHISSNIESVQTSVANNENVLNTNENSSPNQMHNFFYQISTENPPNHGIYKLVDKLNEKSNEITTNISEFASEILTKFDGTKENKIKNFPANETATEESVPKMEMPNEMNLQSIQIVEHILKQATEDNEENPDISTTTETVKVGELNENDKKENENNGFQNAEIMPITVAIEKTNVIEETLLQNKKENSDDASQNSKENLQMTENNDSSNQSLITKVSIELAEIPENTQIVKDRDLLDNKEENTELFTKNNLSTNDGIQIAESSSEINSQISKEILQINQTENIESHVNQENPLQNSLQENGTIPNDNDIKESNSETFIENSQNIQTSETNAPNSPINQNKLDLMSQAENIHSNFVNFNSQISAENPLNTGTYMLVEKPDESHDTQIISNTASEHMTDKQAAMGSWGLKPQPRNTQITDDNLENENAANVISITEQNQNEKIEILNNSSEISQSNTSGEIKNIQNVDTNLTKTHTKQAQESLKSILETEKIPEDATQNSQASDASFENPGYITLTENLDMMLENFRNSHTELENQMETYKPTSNFNENDSKESLGDKFQQLLSTINENLSLEEIETTTAPVEISKPETTTMEMLTTTETPETTTLKTLEWQTTTTESPVTTLKYVEETTLPAFEDATEENSLESLSAIIEEFENGRNFFNSQSIDTTTSPLASSTETSASDEPAVTITSDPNQLMSATTHHQFASLLAETEMNVHKAFETLREWIAKGNKPEEATKNPASNEETATTQSSEEVLFGTQSTTSRTYGLEDNKPSHWEDENSTFKNEEYVKPNKNQDDIDSTTVTPILTTTTASQNSRGSVFIELDDDDEASTQQAVTEKAGSGGEDNNVTSFTGNEEITTETNLNETTTEPTLIRVHLQKDFTGISLTHIDDSSEETTDEHNAKEDEKIEDTLKEDINDKSIDETNTNNYKSNESQTQEPSKEKNYYHDMVTFVQNEPTTQKSDTQKQVPLTQASFMEEQQQQIESTTLNDLDFQSTSTGDHGGVATTNIIEESQNVSDVTIETEQSSTTTDASITTTTTTGEEDDMSTTTNPTEEPEITSTPEVVAAEPEARSLPLPPPKLEYLQNEDGVEVFYGYSIVKHN